MGFKKPHYVLAKKFLPYVYSTGPNGALMHKVASVRMFWDQKDGRRNQCKPAVIAETVCGMSKIVGHYYAKQGEIRARMCEIPDRSSVLCGRCSGELPTFSKRRAERIARQWAHDHLGCKSEGEIIGEYSPPSFPPPHQPAEGAEI